METINGIKDKVAPIAKKYQVERVYLFGSYARGDATEQSDVDLRIDKGKMKGLFKFAGFFSEVENMIGKNKIDIVTTNSLDEEFLNNISKDEVIIYENIE